jgi:hypothetical protein
MASYLAIGMYSVGTLTQKWKVTRSCKSNSRVRLYVNVCMYVCMKPNPGGQIFDITTNYIYKLLFCIIHLKKEFPKGQNRIDPTA